MEAKKKISVIVPVYNEQEVLQESYNQLKSVMDSVGDSYELIFVDDGSSDRTLEILKELSTKDSTVKFLKFSRNFGHEMACTAGMDYSTGDAVILIDGDMQDPPKAIIEMIAKWKEGFSIIYGKRLGRKGESLFKKATAAFYYRFLRSIITVNIPADVSNFRLIDRKVCDEMKKFKEHNRFVRGLFSWIGFRQTSVTYVREERFAGDTKYSLKKMLKLAFDGILSFSSLPLRLPLYLGLLILGGDMVYLFYLFYLRLFTNTSAEGSDTLLFLMLLLQGITLLMVGVIGEYLSRIYEESMDRPLYIVEHAQNFDKSES